jgi:hypothetical protein
LPTVTTPIGAEGLFLQSLKSVDYAVFKEFSGKKYFTEMDEKYLSEELKLES